MQPVKVFLDEEHDILCTSQREIEARAAVAVVVEDGGAVLVLDPRAFAEWTKANTVVVRHDVGLFEGRVETAAVVLHVREKLEMFVGKLGFGLVKLGTATQDENF